jgi:hypothetical protein
MTLDVHPCIWGVARHRRDGLYPPSWPPQCVVGRLSRFGICACEQRSKLRFSCHKCSTMLSYVTMAASWPLHSVLECWRLLLNATRLPL